jgi:hypothetical protein
LLAVTEGFFAAKCFAAKSYAAKCFAAKSSGIAGGATETTI